MCGIAVVLRTGCPSEAVACALRDMEAVQLHRGPDNQGILVEAVGESAFLGLGGQRMAILDLSPMANQPMVSPCGRYVLVYNGEVYNYRELARELCDSPMLGASTGDTGVVLAALAHWGPKALTWFNGMWALAFYDRLTHQLLVSRDRMGVKPLYVYRDARQLLFASEVKAILQVCGRRLPLNADVLARFLVQSVTNDQEQSFFEGIRAVPPATFAEIDLQSDGGHAPRWQSFWQHPYELNSADPGSSPSAEEIRATLLDAVKIRLRSDVPLGVLVSGGTDSSAILGAACAIGGADQVTALSIVSDDQGSNEEPYAELMARHAGCEIRKMRIHAQPDNLLHDLPTACWHNDQPLTGLGPVAHRRLMEQARELGITVLLSGQGADEQLGGYSKFFYFLVAECFRRGHWIRGLDMIVSSVIRGTVISEFRLPEAKRYLPSLRRRAAIGYLGESIFGARLADTSMARTYQEREWLDVRRFSVPMLLHYEDRMSMSWSREIRLPFMDYRLVEQLARVPPHQKLQRGWTKMILRKAVRGLVPEQIRWRRDKKGFTIPEDRWLRGPYRGAVTELFHGPMLAADLGIVRPDGVLRLLARYLAGSQTVGFKDVFNILCLEIWLRRFEPYLTGPCPP